MNCMKRLVFVVGSLLVCCFSSASSFNSSRNHQTSLDSLRTRKLCPGSSKLFYTPPFEDGEDRANQVRQVWRQLSTNGGDLPQRSLDIRSKVGAVVGASALLIVSFLTYSNRQSILSSLNYIKNEWLLTTLDALNAAGPLGLVLYTILFLLWEMTLGITTPVETAAGMAFGPVRGIIVNAIAKLGGSMVSFLLTRYIFFDRIQSRLQNNELLSLMEESVQETPFRVALLCRFSPLPEFVKNCGLGVMSVPKRWFFAAILIHGGFFTCLWTCMGAETARVMRVGGPPSSALKVLMTGATWIGFGAPVLIGLWIKSLKDKQSKRREAKLS